jgi:hypothetical protein
MLSMPGAAAQHAKERDAEANSEYCVFRVAHNLMFRILVIPGEWPAVPRHHSRDSERLGLAPLSSQGER